jgi:hypothetical protein
MLLPSGSWRISDLKGSMGMKFSGVSKIDLNFRTMPKLGAMTFWAAPFFFE